MIDCFFLFFFVLRPNTNNHLFNLNIQLSCSTTVHSPAINVSLPLRRASKRPPGYPSLKSSGWSVTCHVSNRIISLWERFQTTKCKPRTPGVARSADRHGNHMGIEKGKVSSRHTPHVNICDRTSGTSLHLCLRREKVFSSCIMCLTGCCSTNNSPSVHQNANNVFFSFSLPLLSFSLTAEANSCLLAKVGQWRQLSDAGRGGCRAVIFQLQ